MTPSEQSNSALLTVEEAVKAGLSKAELRRTPHEHAVSPNPYISALVCALCGANRRDPIHGSRS